MIANREPDRTSAMNGPPTRVAVIIPIYNESATLETTLRSLTDGDYPSELLEVLIVDGGSTDEWRSIVETVASGSVTIRTLENPSRLTPAGVNIALQSTDAPAVLWISGHCRLEPDYLSKLVAAMHEHENVAVGGRLLVDGQGFAGTLNALVLKSPIGTGLAPWRSRQQSPWVSSVNFALFDRQVLLDIGGLDERLARNQDNDLMRRLTEHGVRFFQADANVHYLAPQTLRGLWRRAWGNASWTIWCWRLGIPSAKWYHIAPMAALLLGILLLIGSLSIPATKMAFYLLAGGYALLALIHTLMVTIPKRLIWAIPLLPIHLFVFHTAYGVGGWAALFRQVPTSPQGSAT